MPQSGRADELSIRSASPQMVEGEAVPASLMGGVWDPSPRRGLVPTWERKAVPNARGDARRDRH